MDEEREGEATRREEMRENGAAQESKPPKSHGGRLVKTIIAIVLLVPVIGMAVWTAVTLNYTYSAGTRAGYVQKFSHKGWLCKTWEGEIAISNVPGQLQEKFDFSVRSDSIAGEINKHIGSRVTLNYEQHRGVPGTCFGETPYFVTGVNVIP